MNLDRIEAVLRLLSRQQHVEELQIDAEAFRLSARRIPGLPALPPAASPSEAAPPRPFVIQAPQVGIFRAGRTPLTVGSVVAPGDSAGQIDSMRILNSIPVEEAGRVEEVLVEDGDAVEYGQSLFVIAPDAAA